MVNLFAKLTLIISLAFHFTLIHAELAPDSLVKFQEAVIAFEANEFKKAQPLFESILDEKQDHLDSIIYLARLNGKLSEWDDAEDLIETGLELAPDNAVVQNLSGRIYGAIAREASIFSALGYAKDCLKGFSRAVELEPSNVEYRKDLISFHLGAPGTAGGDKELALQNAQAIIKLDKKQGFLSLSNVYQAMENKEALNEHFSNIPDVLSKDADVLFSKGMMEQLDENYGGAIASFSKAVESAGDTEEFTLSKYLSVYQIGRTCVISKSDINIGIESLKSYMSEAPALENLPAHEWAEFRLANLLELKGEKKEAKSIYKKIAKSTDDKQLKKQVKQKL